MIGRDSADDFIAAVRELNATVGIPDTTDAIKREDYPLITERAHYVGEVLETTREFFLKSKLIEAEGD